ncbi:TPA: hypothetical protein L3N15_004122 [Vibrio parahaemolyticus]|nr:hypothetical protein [Vibrio parahaemolyticus]
MILDFDFAFKKLEPSGLVEHTDLTDIDRAVAAFLLRVICSFTITDRARKENKEFAQFIDRADNTKLCLGIFDSHEDFLKKWSAECQKRSKAKVGDETKTQRDDMLPVFYVGRDLTFVYNETDGHNDETWCETLYDDPDAENPVTLGKVNKSYPRLTYNVTVLAWEKSTISRLATGVTMWLRHTKLGRKHTFSADTIIAGAPMQLGVSVEGARDITGMPVPVDFGESRIWGQSFAIEFTSEFVEVEFVEQRDINVSTSWKLMK